MKKKPHLWWRIRGLDKMEGRFGKNKPIENFIKERLKSEKIVRILEFGFGEGKCLLDLRSLFPSERVELHGINEKKEGDMKGRSDFISNAKKLGISVPQRNLLPKPVFYDAGKGLKYKSNYFDLIISQVAFPYVDDKMKLLEEFWRVLKVGGRAFLHVDSYEKTFPDILQINKETPRLNIYDNNRLVTLTQLFKKYRARGFDITFDALKKDKILYGIIRINKNTAKPLKFHLKYDDDASFDLYRFIHEKKIRNVWWGKRSVFRATR